MDVDRVENKEELSFVPRAVGNSAGWREPQFMCDRQCRKEGFKFHGMASILVEDDGEPHTMNQRMTPIGDRWRIRVVDKSSRGKLPSFWVHEDSKTRCGSATEPKRCVRRAYWRKRRRH